MQLESWSIFIAALVVSAGTMVLLWRGGRRGRVLWCLGGALVCLSLAAGGLSWQWRQDGEVTVMVDLSASTRTAAYREGGYLQQRVGQLLGDRPHRLVFFAADNQPADGIPLHELGDMPGDRTRYAPPADADDVLLFSDARFELPPQGPPAYVVVDPSLEKASERDSVVTDLRLVGDEAVAGVRGTGQMDERRWSVVSTSGNEGDARTLVTAVKGERRVTARVNGKDAWPENDALSVVSAAPWLSQRWWVGDDPPSGWQAMSARQLPQDAAAWLLPAVVVLNDIRTTDLSPLQTDRLVQYVRDLGGGVVLSGTVDGRADVRGLSPLSDDPPRPVRQWVILVDASGSMNESSGGQTRWQWAQRAMRDALGAIPAMDQVDVGGFSDSVRWWVRGASAGDVRNMASPTADAHPHGPTNLQQALEEVVGALRSHRGLPADIVLLSDTEARMGEIDALVRQMEEAHARLWVLATKHGSAFDALQEIARRTGGAILEESRLDQWGQAMAGMVDKARGSTVHHQAIGIHFDGELARLRPRGVPVWREAWLKQGAERLVSADGNMGYALGGDWRVGLGRVAAAAFAPDDAEIAAMVDIVASRPGDPRLKLSWGGGASPYVRVDAVTDAGYLNHLKLVLSLRSADDSGDSGTMSAIPQTGPGQYELKYAAARHEAIATVLEEGRVVGRFAVAGRYAPEFNAVGNDHPAMRQLAQMTGGQVISPRQTSAIDLLMPRQSVSLASWMGMCAAALIAAALMMRRV